MKNVKNCFARPGKEGCYLRTKHLVLSIQPTLHNGGVALDGSDNNGATQPIFHRSLTLSQAYNF